MAANSCPGCGEWVSNPTAPNSVTVWCMTCKADALLARLGARLLVKMEFDEIVRLLDD